jgi:phosphatidylserine/phosphatidylglycerophosphate/cardiolipin synthase-like enzyme
MSQVVSRFVAGDVTSQSLHGFVEELAVPGFPARRYLSGDARSQILEFLADADRRGSEIFAAIYEMNDRELVEALKPFGARGHLLLGNGGATQAWVATELTTAGLDVRHRDLSRAGRSSPSVHNKFVVEVDPGGRIARRVLTGSTNWTTTGLCTQLNNVLLIERSASADRFRAQWDKLVAAGDSLPPALKAANGEPTSDGPVEILFAATKDEAEFEPVRQLIAGARRGIVFLMFMPGNSPLLQALLDRAQANDIYVRGVVSRVQGSGPVVSVGGQVVKSGTAPEEFHSDILVPAGITEAHRPSWAETEFNAGQMLGEHMIAIVHSKVIVVDPFSDGCAVVTGSHNFSEAASQKNDENLVIVRGNKTLAQAYALHINGVYDHYAWRSYLAGGGDPNRIYQGMDGWKPGGARANELAFWMGQV